MSDNIIFESKPTLRSPYVVCGLNGWVNGGDVSIAGVNYLIRKFDAEKFAEMPASDYHIYQIPGGDNLRPIFKMEEGIIEETQLPKNEFFFARNPSAEHDFIFFLGTEPNLKWEEYAATVVGLAADFKAARLFTMCGLFDRSPYTREPLISCTCTSPEIKQEMEKYSVTFSHREGPASFNQMLIYACEQKGLEGVNFTVRVPLYPEHNVFIGYSPRSLKAVLVRLKDLMQVDINLEELDGAIEEVEKKLDSFRRQNPEFNSFIEELEKDYVEMPYEESLNISASDAVRLAEEFLKKQDD